MLLYALIIFPHFFIPQLFNPKETAENWKIWRYTWYSTQKEPQNTLI